MFSKYLLANRIASGLTQGDIAAGLAARGHRYSQRTIAYWENSTRRVPLHIPGFVEALAMTLGVPAVDILVAAGLKPDLFHAPTISVSTPLSSSRELGKTLYVHRRQKRWTQLWLAMRLTERGFNYSRLHISDWETGKTAVPIDLVQNDRRLVDVLCELLEIPATEFIPENPTASSEPVWDADTLDMAGLYFSCSPEERDAVRRVLLAFHRKA